jgi:hypothetical protein
MIGEYNIQKAHQASARDSASQGSESIQNEMTTAILHYFG